MAARHKAPSILYFYFFFFFFSRWCLGRCAMRSDSASFWFYNKMCEGFLWMVFDAVLDIVVEFCYFQLWVLSSYWITDSLLYLEMFHERWSIIFLSKKICSNTWLQRYCNTELIGCFYLKLFANLLCNHDSRNRTKNQSCEIKK